jgi:hypothetical protein
MDVTARNTGSDFSMTLMTFKHRRAREHKCQAGTAHAHCSLAKPHEHVMADAKRDEQERDADDDWRHRHGKQRASCCIAERVQVCTARSTPPVMLPMPCWHRQHTRTHRIPAQGTPALPRASTAAARRAREWNLS